MTKIQRMNNDMATFQRRETTDNTIMDRRDRNDELTQERRAKTDKSLVDNRLRNDEKTADRRQTKDTNSLTVTALFLGIIVVLLAGVYFIF